MSDRVRATRFEGRVPRHLFCPNCETTVALQILDMADPELRPTLEIICDLLRDGRILIVAVEDAEAQVREGKAHALVSTLDNR